MDQPVHQPMTDMLDHPRRALDGAGIGGQPRLHHPFRRSGALFAGAGHGQVAHPAETVHDPIERGGQPRGGPEIDLRDRRLDAMHKEMPRTQRDKPAARSPSNGDETVANRRGRAGLAKGADNVDPDTPMR